MTAVSRRAALLGAAALGAIGALAATPFVILRRSRAGVAAAIVKNIFGEHVMAPDQLKKFSDELAKRLPQEYGLANRLVSRSIPRFDPLYEGLHSIGYSSPSDQAHAQYIEVATAFLRATNYGTRDAKEAVIFTGFPDLTQPLSCTNPFARFDFDD